MNRIQIAALQIGDHFQHDFQRQLFVDAGTNRTAAQKEAQSQSDLFAVFFLLVVDITLNRLTGGVEYLG